MLTDNYGTNIGLYLGPVYVEFTRGFVIVDVDVKGETFRFVNTHLEVSSAPESVFRVVQPCGDEPGGETVENDTRE